MINTYFFRLVNVCRKIYSLFKLFKKDFKTKNQKIQFQFSCMYPLTKNKIKNLDLFFEYMNAIRKGFSFLQSSFHIF